MATGLLGAAPRNRYSLYPSFGDFYFDPGMPEMSPYRESSVHYGPVHRTIDEARAFWLSPGLEDALGRPDVIHANNFWCPPQSLRSARLVYTLYDLSFLTDPTWTTELNRAACWDGVSRALEKADWITAISHFTRAHFLRMFPLFPSERVRVISPPSRFAGWSGEARPPAALGGVPSQGFWLSVGTLEPRKNQRRIAAAYAAYLRSGGAALPLVFAGGYGWLMQDFRDELAGLGILSSVVFTGYVPDAELAWLYRHCYGHVYASLFEGFGLPVLEGLSFGAPTITSATTSLPEVAGDAALLVDPLDVEALASAMLGIGKQRERLSALARERAARFDGRASVETLAGLYEEAISLPKRSTPHPRPGPRTGGAWLVG